RPVLQTSGRQPDLPPRRGDLPVESRVLRRAVVRRSPCPRTAVRGACGSHAFEIADPPRSPAHRPVHRPTRREVPPARLRLARTDQGGLNDLRTAYLPP